MIVGEEKQFTALRVRPKTRFTLMARLSPGGMHLGGCTQPYRTM